MVPFEGFFASDVWKHIDEEQKLEWHHSLPLVRQALANGDPMHAKSYFLSGSNLARIAGLSLVVATLVGGILAAGNLYFIQSPDDLVQQFRSQLASQMVVSNMPPEFRERFTSGTLLSDEDRAKLTPEAKEVIEKFESMLPVLRTTVNRAVEQSRTKSQLGLIVCAVVFVGGIVLILVSRRGGGV